MTAIFMYQVTSIDSSNDTFHDEGSIDRLILNAHDLIMQIVNDKESCLKKTLVAFHSDRKHPNLKTIIFKAKEKNRTIYHGYRIKVDHHYVKHVRKYVFSNSLKDILRSFDCSANFLDDLKDKTSHHSKFNNSNPNDECSSTRMKDNSSQRISKSIQVFVVNSSQNSRKELSKSKKSRSSSSHSRTNSSSCSSHRSKSHHKAASAGGAQSNDMFNTLKTPEIIPKHMRSNFIASTFHSSPVTLPKKLLTYTASPMEDPKYRAQKPASKSTITTEAESNWK